MPFFNVKKISDPAWDDDRSRDFCRRVWRGARSLSRTTASSVCLKLATSTAHLVMRLTATGVTSSGDPERRGTTFW